MPILLQYKVNCTVMTGIGGSYGSWWQSVLTEKMRAGFIIAALQLGLSSEFNFRRPRQK